ncbi:hypothetical protein TNCT_100601 [Trichonephila clavata]|uniref:Uncharacterized protein n=1 Tax=Trichonephila clavata TaxID=2740835 RepID=A0A8X6K805_TRICU|nr:hypothetical protein TNCT_100601 [Trichonephila clavata]
MKLTIRKTSRKLHYLFSPYFLFIHNSAAKVFAFIREERETGAQNIQKMRGKEKNRRARSAFTEHLFCCGSGRTIAPWRSESFGGDVTHVAPHESAWGVGGGGSRAALCYSRTCATISVMYYDRSRAFPPSVPLSRSGKM